MGKNKVNIIAEPGKQDILITREFEAPRELVFKAFTDKKLLERWMKHRDLETKFIEFEAKNGASWRFVQSDPRGNKYEFHGVIHEILPSERIIQTFEFDGLPEKGHVALETTKFEELPDERTRITTLSVFQSVEDRDGMVQSGMEVGVQGNYANLDEILQKLNQ